MFKYDFIPLDEKYVTKYDAFGDDDEEFDSPNRPVDYLTRSEVHSIIGVIKGCVSKYPKLAKCCEFININDNDKYDADGNYASAYDLYKDGKANSYFRVIEGDVWDGYPDFNGDGADTFANDKREFIKDVNKEFNTKGIKAFFTSKNEGGSGTISFGLKSLKYKK